MLTNRQNPTPQDLKLAEKRYDRTTAHGNEEAKQVPTALRAKNNELF